MVAMVGLAEDRKEEGVKARAAQALNFLLRRSSQSGRLEQVRAINAKTEQNFRGVTKWSDRAGR
jgi:hypothetical protein